jgi:pentatricopeptide repeat protein
MRKHTKRQRRPFRPWEVTGDWQRHDSSSSVDHAYISTSIPPLMADFSPAEQSRRNDYLTELYKAVATCDGTRAEEIASRILLESEHSQSTFDGHVLSLVLRAWNNQMRRTHKSARPSNKKERKNHLLNMEEIALRSHKVLQQLKELNDNGILAGSSKCPTAEDCVAVLECWYETCSFASTLALTYGDKLANHCLRRAVNYAEEAWQQSEKFSLFRDGEANIVDDGHLFWKSQEDITKGMVLYMKILGLDGRDSTAENLFNEALGFPASDSENDNSKSIVSGRHQFPICFDNDQILELCHCVLGAYRKSTKTSAADLAQKFIQRMHNDPVLPNPDAACYNILFGCWKKYSQNSRDGRQKKQRTLLVAEKVESLLSDMKAARIRPDLTSYNYVIDALSHAGEAVRAEKVLTQLVKDYTDQFDASLKPDAEPFESVLWSYSLERNGASEETAERAESLVKNMRLLYESGLLETNPTVWCYNICLKIWSNSNAPNALDRAMDLYERMQPSDKSNPHDDTTSCDQVQIEGYNRIESRDDSSRHVETGSREAGGVMPDSTSMNTVLRVSKYTMDADTTEKLLFRFLEEYRQDPSSYPSPDTISFSTAISSWSSSRDDDAPLRAERLLQYLEDLFENGNVGCRPDVGCYSAVMKAWAYSNRPEAVEKTESILRRLLDADSIQPDIVCWNTAIAAAGSAGMGQKAEDLFREMVNLHLNDPTSSVAPNDITFTNVCNGWAKKRCGSAAEAIIHLLKEVEKLCSEGLLPFQPNVVHYSIVLDCLAYAKSRETAELAESMLRDMVRSNDRNLQPNTITYNSVLKAWSFLRVPDAAEKAISLMEEMITLFESCSSENSNGFGRKVRPNANTFGSVLHAIANSNLEDKSDRAMEVVRLMDKYGYVCNEWCNRELSKCLSGKSNNSINMKENKPRTKSHQVER